MDKRNNLIIDEANEVTQEAWDSLKVKKDEELLPEAIAVIGSIVAAALMVGCLLLIQGVS